MKKGGCNISAPDDATGFELTNDDFNKIIFRTGTDNDLETFSPDFHPCLRSFQPSLLKYSHEIEHTNFQCNQMRYW